MSIDRTTRLFFDASCLVAAAGSPTGGSSFVLALCQRGFLRAVISQPVLLEAHRNVQEQMDAARLERLEALFLDVPLEVVPVPQERETLQQARAVAGEKDTHVLAAALAAGTPLLICLDKPLVERINHAGLALQALSPGDFIKELLPTHPDYPSIR